MILQRTHELPTPAPLSSKSLPLVFFPRSFRPLFSPSFPRGLLAVMPRLPATSPGVSANRRTIYGRLLLISCFFFVLFFCFFSFLDSVRAAQQTNWSTRRRNTNRLPTKWILLSQNWLAIKAPLHHQHHPHQLQQQLQKQLQKQQQENTISQEILDKL